MNKNQKHSLIIYLIQIIFDRAKLQQDLALSTDSSTSEWITGGAIGSKNAVLVFKTSALLQNTNYDDDNDSMQQPSTSGVLKANEKCLFPPVADAKPATTAGVRPNKLSAIAKKSESMNFDLHERKRLSSKPTSDSLSSSSENSISSACDDPAEFEADIVQAEKADSDEAKAKTSTNQHKSFHGSGDLSANKENVITRQSCENIAGEDGYASSSSVSEMPASILNITYKFTNTETKLLKRILSSHGMKETEENQNFNLLWTGSHMKPDILRNLLPYQRVNHFPR